jgi:glyoxylate utilization-related uncharacterized protein
MVLPAGGWAPQPHVHPSLTEEYEVLEGSLELLIGREWRLLRQGDHAAVPPGTVHTFRVGDGPARVRNVHRPARGLRAYIQRLCRTANERSLGDLRSPPLNCCTSPCSSTSTRNTRARPGAC